MIVRHSDQYRWEDVSVLAYKETGTHFKSITRQILFEGLGDLPVQLRYFEIQPGGHSTLERHQHVHLVYIARGHGHALDGEDIYEVREHDVISISPGTLHQFRATADVPLGFLCLVNVERDKPYLPTEEDLDALRQNPKLAEFIRS